MSNSRRIRIRKVASLIILAYRRARTDTGPRSTWQISGKPMPEYIRLFIPPITGDELDCLRDAIERRELAGNGHYTQLCNSWLVNQVGVGEALLTVSCTAALEMAAILSDLNSADE